MNSGTRMTHYRPTRVEIDLGKIEHNTRQIRAYADRKKMGLIGVVKADAYGHGASMAAKAIIRGGAGMLAVALIEEGISLRKEGIDAPILVMGAISPGSTDAYMKYNLTATINDFSDALLFEKELRQSVGRVKVHIKVDTGMGRLGILPKNAVRLADMVSSHSFFQLEGVYSHLATADDANTAVAENQVRVFNDVLRWLDEACSLPRYRHIVNSAGLIGIDSGLTNMARVGLLLYGLYPAPHLHGKVNVVPALVFKSHVASLKRVPAGASVGYGHTYTALDETSLVTVPVGYADGFKRGLSSKADVLIRGKRYTVAGRICMDQTIVDVGHDKVATNDEVVLLGTQGEETITPDEWAQHLGTINYEIIPSISNRVPRVYVGEMKLKRG